MTNLLSRTMDHLIAAQQRIVDIASGETLTPVDVYFIREHISAALCFITEVENIMQGTTHKDDNEPRPTESPSPASH